jgi:hypothetical protein
MKPARILEGPRRNSLCTIYLVKILTKFLTYDTRGPLATPARPTKFPNSTYRFTTACDAGCWNTFEKNSTPATTRPPSANADPIRSPVVGGGGSGKSYFFRQLAQLHARAASRSACVYCVFIPDPPAKIFHAAVISMVNIRYNQAGGFVKRNIRNITKFIITYTLLYYKQNSY